MVAIAIPIFTTQLEKSREATDLANIRAAYAVVQSAALTQDDTTTIAKNNNNTTTYTSGSGKYTAVVKMKQKQDKWQSGAQDVGGVTLAADTAKKDPGTCTVEYDESTGQTTFTFSAS